MTEPIYNHPHFKWVAIAVVVLLILVFFMSSAEHFSIELPDWLEKWNPLK
jgi:hypothetical protein